MTPSRQYYSKFVFPPVELDTVHEIQSQKYHVIVTSPDRVLKDHRFLDMSKQV
jgi:hypothetical protein